MAIVIPIDTFGDPLPGFTGLTGFQNIPFDEVQDLAFEAPDADEVDELAEFGFDAVPETLAKPTLGDLEAGDRVHLEHAVPASTLMGGHFVQGHVDGVGRVDEIRRGSDWRLIIAAPADLMPYFSPKGSVAVAGVSLTLAHIRPDDHLFELAIIPTTLELTKLGDLSPGSRVNIEADMLAKVAVQTVERTARALLADSARGPTS